MTTAPRPTLSISDDTIRAATREALTDLKARIDAELGRRRQHGDAQTVKDLLDLAHKQGWTTAQGDVVEWLRRRLTRAGVNG